MRTMIATAALGIALAVAGAGCGGSDSTAVRAPEAAPPGSDVPTTSGAPAPTSEAPTTGHAAGIVPGSYEDWCPEHEVPETQCTRCDASLIPAFKAVGDWDEKHGLPKSQCLKCDPTLRIVRPPKPEVSG